MQRLAQYQPPHSPLFSKTDLILSQQPSNWSHPEALTLVPERTPGEHPKRWHRQSGRCWMDLQKPTRLIRCSYQTEEAPPGINELKVSSFLYALSTYLPLWRKVLAGHGECSPRLVGQLRLRAHWQRPRPLAPPLSSLQSSTSGQIQGLQLNARVCTQCLPEEVLVTCLFKIPRLCILAAFSSCIHGIEYGGAAAWCKLPNLWATAPTATDDNVGKAACLLAWRNFTLKSTKIAVEKEITSTINYLLQPMWQVSYPSPHKQFFKATTAFPLLGWGN